MKLVSYRLQTSIPSSTPSLCASSDSDFKTLTAFALPFFEASLSYFPNAPYSAPVKNLDPRFAAASKELNNNSDPFSTIFVSSLDTSASNDSPREHTTFMLFARNSSAANFWSRLSRSCKDNSRTSYLSVSAFSLNRDNSSLLVLPSNTRACTPILLTIAYTPSMPFRYLVHRTELIVRI